MAQSRSSRQLLAVVVLIASSAALVATSPPTPPTKTLDARASATATLTSGSPVASTTVTFSASDEALWSDDPEIRITTASLSFSLHGSWGTTGVRGPAPSSDAAPGASSAPIVRLTVVPLVDGEQRDPIVGTVTSASVDLRQTCPADRDCRAEYELILEWVDPRPGPEVTVVVESNALVQIEGPETLPVGATTRLEASRPVAVEVPLVSDAVDGRATLDAAHPLAMWSVLVDADAGAIPAPLEWPIESRGTFVATITAGPEGRATEYGDGPGAAIVLIPADGPELVPEGGSTPRLAFDPFGGCRPAEPCRHRFTVVARWFAVDPTVTAAIAWHLDAGIVYHGDIGPGPGAAVSATVGGETLVSSDGAGLTATLEGTATLDPSRPGIGERRTLELAIPALALSSDLLGGPVPAVTARVRLDARASAPVGGDPISILTDWWPDQSFARATYLFPEPVLDGGPIEALVFPANGCRADRACAAELRLGLGVPALKDGSRLEKVEVTVAWRVDVELRYPPGVRPPAGVAMDLRDVTP